MGFGGQWSESFLSPTSLCMFVGLGDCNHLVSVVPICVAHMCYPMPVSVYLLVAGINKICLIQSLTSQVLIHLSSSHNPSCFLAWTSHHLCEFPSAISSAWIVVQQQPCSLLKPDAEKHFHVDFQALPLQGTAPFFIIRWKHSQHRQNSVRLSFYACHVHMNTYIKKSKLEHYWKLRSASWSVLAVVSWLLLHNHLIPGPRTHTVLATVPVASSPKGLGLPSNLCGHTYSWAQPHWVTHTFSHLNAHTHIHK